MNILADYLSQLPATEADKRFVDKSMQLSGLIEAAMQRQGLTQRALAELLGKKESEVSRWLSGLHNFTLKTITRLEAVLGEDLVLAYRDRKRPAVRSQSAGCRSVVAGSSWTEASFRETSASLTQAARQADAASVPMSYAEAA